MSTSETKTPTIMEVGEMLEQMGVQSFDAALPEGKIHWMDGDGKMLANAECKVILSFAATNKSILWGEAIPGFADAGVPFIPTPKGKKTVAMDYHEPQARHLAAKTAEAHDADFLYRAATGGGGFLYLAIYKFKLGKVELGKKDKENRTTSVKHFNREMAENLLDVLDREEFEEMVVLMEAWKGKLANQLKYVVKGLDIEEEVENLMDRIDVFIDKAQNKRKGLAKMLDDESELWW